MLNVATASGRLPMDRNAVSFPAADSRCPAVGSVPAWGAGFHLNFEPKVRSQRLPHALSRENHSTKTIDTAGRLGPPLVTNFCEVCLQVDRRLLFKLERTRLNQPFRDCE